MLSIWAFPGPISIFVLFKEGACNEKSFLFCEVYQSFSSFIFFSYSETSCTFAFLPLLFSSYFCIKISHYYIFNASLINCSIYGLVEFVNFFFICCTSWGAHLNYFSILLFSTLTLHEMTLSDSTSNLDTKSLNFLFIRIAISFASRLSSDLPH